MGNHFCSCRIAACNIQEVSECKDTLKYLKMITFASTNMHIKKWLSAVLVVSLVGLTRANPVGEPEGEADAEASADPQFNSLLTTQALASHPLSHPFLPATPNAVAAATAAARQPHPGLPFLHPALHPALPIPSLHPTLQSHVPLGACRLLCSILDLLVFNPNFSTLVSLIKAANLIPLMSQPGPLTVFAPTNAAFDLLPPAEFEQLLADPVALKAVLLRHMTKGAIHSVDLPAGAIPLITGAGERVTLTRLPTSITVTSVAGVSRVIEADNEASNGLVHVVDKVF